VLWDPDPATTDEIYQRPERGTETSLASQTHFRKWVWLARLNRNVRLLSVSLLEVSSPSSTVE